MQLALQSNLNDSVLTNDGTLGAGISELKPGVAAPNITKVTKKIEKEIATILH